MLPVLSRSDDVIVGLSILVGLAVLAVLVMTVLVSKSIRLHNLRRWRNHSKTRIQNAENDLRIHVSHAENPAYSAKSDEPADSPRNSYELLFKAQPSRSTKGGKVAKKESDALLSHSKHTYDSIIECDVARGGRTTTALVCSPAKSVTEASQRQQREPLYENVEAQVRRHELPANFSSEDVGRRRYTLP